MAYVVIDGTLIPIDRIAVDRPFYSGKHKRHGVNLTSINDIAGTLFLRLRVAGAVDQGGEPLVHADGAFTIGLSHAP